MSKIQIKRYNGGTSTWENQFPITKAQHLVATSDGTTTVFDENDKLKVNFLPNAVFDSLYFFNFGTGQLIQEFSDAHKNARSMNRSSLGYYWIVNATSGQTLSAPSGAATFMQWYAFGNVAVSGSENLTLTNTSNLAVGMIIIGTGIPENTTIVSITNSTTIVMSNSATQNGDGNYLEIGYMVSTRIVPGEEKDNSFQPTSVTVERGDWYIITKIVGVGSVASPFVVSFATVNNTYELASTTVDGITRLSSQTVWSSLAGNNVITDERLKALADGQFQPQINTLADRVQVFYDGTPTGMVTDDLWFDAV
jgi:hypothetical protein